MSVMSVMVNESSLTVSDTSSTRSSRIMALGWFVITATKEVMCYLAFFCLFVSRITEKLVDKCG